MGNCTGSALKLLDAQILPSCVIYQVRYSATTTCLISLGFWAFPTKNNSNRQRIEETRFISATWFSALSIKQKLPQSGKGAQLQEGKGNTNRKALFLHENHAKTSKALLILRELFQS